MRPIKKSMFWGGDKDDPMMSRHDVPKTSKDWRYREGRFSKNQSYCYCGWCRRKRAKRILRAKKSSRSWWNKNWRTINI